MISKYDLVGKYISYLDKNGKQRSERVLKVSGSYVTVINAIKVKHRVHKDKVLYRQFRKRGRESIDWDKKKVKKGDKIK